MKKYTGDIDQQGTKTNIFANFAIGKEKKSLIKHPI